MPSEPQTAPEILCEDGPVVAVNKPPGLISQGAPEGVDSLVHQVKDYLRLKYDKPGNVYLGVPHRIDRPTSGVVVFSRNSKCAARLAEQFQKRQVKKTYLAVVEGSIEPEEGTLEDWLYRVPDHSYVEICSEDRLGAKHARLSYRVLDRKRGRSLVEIDLETGRMHQIRIQFASRGWPVVGDRQYGAKTAFRDYDDADAKISPIALHARRLTLLHPVRYDELTITAPVPEIWKEFGFDLKQAHMSPQREQGPS
jgi:23S rRNA pseudouridine1911/1915/1917 synthase